MTSVEMRGYLDLETGAVIYVSDDARRELERVYETMPEEVWQASDGEQGAAFAAALEAYGRINVEREELEDAQAVDDGLGTRFVELPAADTRESYRDMESFIDTVTTPPPSSGSTERSEVAAPSDDSRARSSTTWTSGSTGSPTSWNDSTTGSARGWRTNASS